MSNPGKNIPNDSITLYQGDLPSVFDVPELADIPAVSKVACAKFAEGVPEYRFLFLSGWSFRSKKALVSGIEEILIRRQVSYEYILMEDFIDLYIDAVRNYKADAFEDRYENLPVLILDGIEHIAGKEATQEEFCKFIRKRFIGDKPTFIITSLNLESYGFDRRILELLSEWVNISVG